MDPGGAAVLQHAQNQRGARRVEHAAFARVADDLVVRGQQGVAQELAHIGQLGPSFALEQGRDGLQRQLGGDFAFGVAAHAIGQDEQGGVPGVAIAHPVFIFFTTTTAADLKDRELHLSLAPAAGLALGSGFLSASMVSNCKRTFSPTESLV